MISYVGCLVEDKTSGKKGLIVEQKQWTIETSIKKCVTRYGKEGIPILDFYVHWFDGEVFWVDDENITILSN